MTAQQAGGRLDALLGQWLGRSRSQVLQLLEAGAVEVDGRPMTVADKGCRLEPGGRVRVDGPALALLDAIVPQPTGSLRVLAEGDGWLALDKPAGMPVHPLQPGETGTLLNAVAGRYPQVQGVGEGGLRSGVVHRLDVDTSGVLAVALTDVAWRRLRDAFERQAVRKMYRAIVLGAMTGHRHESLPLYVARHRPARVAVVVPGRADAADSNRRRRDVRQCELHWRALEPLHGATLIEIDLHTGFLHQIRAMLAHRGHPVAGDTLYARPETPDLTSAPRQMLHAASLQLDGVTVVSDDPPDFARTLARLREAGDA